MHLVKGDVVRNLSAHEHDVVRGSEVGVVRENQVGLRVGLAGLVFCERGEEDGGGKGDGLGDGRGRRKEGPFLSGAIEKRSVMHYTPAPLA